MGKGEKFEPYWLIHEPGKEHGFGTVPYEDAWTPELAVEEWIRQNPEWVEMFGRAAYEGATARLIRERIVPKTVRINDGQEAS